MKRLLSVLLIVFILLSFASCGKTGNQKSKESTDSKKTEEVSSNDEDMPLLWRATDKKGREIYFFGTIHLGDKRNKEILKRLQPTLEKCDALAVECDVVAYLKDLSAQQEDLKTYILDDGTKITDHIPDELYEKLVALFKEHKVYNSWYDYCKPALWSQLFDQVIVEMTDLDTNKGMDNLLIKDANSAGREVLEVESVKFQNDLLANASDEYYTLALQSEVDDPEESAKALLKLYELWLEGNEKKLYEFACYEEESEDLSVEERKVVEDYNEKILTERNIGMVKKAKQYLKDEKTVFYAVGAMHFLGDDGIKALLIKEGFKFERIKY